MHTARLLQQSEHPNVWWQSITMATHSLALAGCMGPTAMHVAVAYLAQLATLGAKYNTATAIAYDQALRTRAAETEEMRPADVASLFRAQHGPTLHEVTMERAWAQQRHVGQAPPRPPAQSAGRAQSPPRGRPQNKAPQKGERRDRQTAFGSESTPPPPPGPPPALARNPPPRGGGGRGKGANSKDNGRRGRQPGN